MVVCIIVGLGSASTLDLAIINGKRKDIAVTKIQITPKYSEVKPEGFYVYIHRRATDGSPFYVGKGKGNRAWERNKSDCRSDHWINCARKNGVFVDVILSKLDEKSAYDKEREVITVLEYVGYDLVNQSRGGIGPLGQKVSEETRRKISSSFDFPVWNDDGEKFRNNCDAARAMRNRGYPKAAPSAIQSASSPNGKSNTAYGHAWSKTGIPEKPKAHGYVASNISKMMPVVCVDTDERFNSGADAARWVSRILGRSVRGHRILTCAQGKSNTAYGYKWRLLKDE